MRLPPFASSCRPGCVRWARANGVPLPLTSCLHTSFSASQRAAMSQRLSSCESLRPSPVAAPHGAILRPHRPLTQPTVQLHPEVEAVQLAAVSSGSGPPCRGRTGFVPCGRHLAEVAAPQRAPKRSNTPEGLCEELAGAADCCCVNGRAVGRYCIALQGSPPPCALSCLGAGLLFWCGASACQLGCALPRRGTSGSPGGHHKTQQPNS